jgi:type IV pilus assembly protein PilB
MVAATVEGGLTGLARALVTHSWLTENEAKALQSAANNANESVVTHLVRTKKFGGLKLAEFAAQTYGFPLIDLTAIDPETLPKGVIDPRLSYKRRVIALGVRGNRLYVGISDPGNLAAIDEVKFSTGKTIEPVVVEDDKLAQLIEKGEDDMADTFKNLDSESLDLEVLDEETQERADEAAAKEVDDAPVVRYLHKIMLDAINAGASDIHFEPYEKFYRIRYRMDGILYETALPPLAIKEKIASRIKVISKLDISEKRVPQDGRLKLVLSRNRAIDFRISTLPTLYGEKIVMRILDSSAAKLNIDMLGYEPEQKEMLLKAIERPYGMILATGPTGSGKTVSLYTCLNLLNKPGINISTAEDPAEINLPGINQVNMNEKAGLTFANALRAFLRQDPDIIMVGEIRDLETADIAVKAAQTGHLVLSTVHTNDAPQTLTRLAQMGVAPFNIASSVLLITAQRLARRLCLCKKPVDLPKQVLLRAGFTEEDLEGGWTPYAHKGCDQCKDTGYKGRVGLYQVMPITEEMQRIILRNGSALDIGEQARREGIIDLRRAGLLKVKAGITSLEEVEAVTND